MQGPNRGPLPHIPLDTSWRENNPADMYNTSFLNHDPLAGMGNNYSHGELGLMNHQQPQSSVLQAMPGHSVAGQGMPNTLLEQDAYNVLFGGDLTGPSFPPGGNFLETLGQSALNPNNGGYGGLPDLPGHFGLPLNNLARLSAESAPGASFFSEFRRGSFDGDSGSHAHQQFTGLNRHSMGPLVSQEQHSQPQHIWEGPRQHSLPGLPVMPKSEFVASLQDQGVYGYDYNRPPAGRWQEAPEELAPATREPQAPAPREQSANLDLATLSGNSLDSSPDLTANQWENQLPGVPNVKEEKTTNGDDVQRQREKNRNAQKRFRQRQKEKMKDSQQQMEALTQQMNRLMQEKAELETRNRILEQVVRLNVEHVDQLQSNKEVLNIEQMMLLENYTEFFSKVKQQPKESVEDAKKWLVGDLIIKDFQAYIDRISELHTQAMTLNDPHALEQLNELILLRREHEKQGALFSCFYWAVYCWNVEETQKRTSEMPPPSKWQQVLDDLQLTREQKAEMLNARRRMLARLNNLVGQRRSMIAQLGLELLQAGREKLHSCPVVQELRVSLEAEREAVFNFMFTAVDETLTPAQEAFLDISSYPWCPDIWTITCLLAQQSKEPMQTIPALDVSSPVLDPILPHFTAFKLLITPITAYGIGLRLKRGLAMCKTQGVLPKAAYPILTQKQLVSRSFLEVQCGRWKKFSTRDWQTRCLLADEIVPNALESKDEGYVSP